MRASEPIRFALGGAACASLGAAAAVLLAGGAAGGGAAWALLGSAATALPGVAAGAWLVLEHGRPGPRFLIAFVAGLGVRLPLVAAVTIAAVRAGGVAVPAGLIGLLAGFLAVTLYEAHWFVRRAAAPPAATEVLR